MRHIKLSRILILFAILFVIAPVAIAQAPNTIMYQGRLTDTDGAPITATTQVIFTIYDAATLGTDLFADTIDITPDANGLFTAELGPVDAGIFNGAQRFIGIKAGTDAEMSPRQLMTSAPYALRTQMVPGIAHAFRYSGFNLNNTLRPVDSISITVPSNGYVVVHAQGFFQMSKNATSDDYMRASISSSATGIDFDNFAYWRMDSAPDGSYTNTMSIVKAQSVTAGTHKWYLNADCGNGITGSINRTHILATFYPTSYGTVINSSPTNIDPNSVSGEAID
ncbi:MAG: hypothetical protein ABIE07_03580 [Candidatus Zixiibacteriota bacterium]